MNIESIILAFGIAVFPIPIITLVLVLQTKKRFLNGASFILAWISSLTIMSSLVMFLLDPFDSVDSDDVFKLQYIIKGILGLLLIIWSIYKIIKTRKASAETPKWISNVSAFDSKQSFLAGFLLGGLNPKNILLLIAIYSSFYVGYDLSIAGKLFNIFIVVIIATSVLLFVFIISIIERNKKEKVLDKLRLWLEKNGTLVLSGILILIGLDLVISSIVKLF